MTLQDEIAEALRNKRQEFKRIENLGRDRDILLAQAAIDVVEQRLSDQKPRLSYEGEVVINRVWQQVKEGLHE